MIMRFLLPVLIKNPSFPSAMYLLLQLYKKTSVFLNIKFILTHFLQLVTLVLTIVINVMLNPMEYE